MTSPTDPGSPRTSTATTPVAANAALTILKTANEASVIPGGTASFSIVVSNAGPSDAASVIVDDPVPAGLVFVANAGACTSAYPCDIGPVAAGQSRTITTTFQVPADYSGPSPIVNVATVDSPSDPGGPHSDDATVPLGSIVEPVAVPVDSALALLLLITGVLAAAVVHRGRQRRV